MSAGRSSWNFASNLLGSSNRPPLEKLYAYAFMLGLAYMIADLTILKVRPDLLPLKSVATPKTKNKLSTPKRLSYYNHITSRNLFSKEGTIPPDLASEGKDDKGNTDGPATASNLPLALKGTIVHGNPKKSVASVEVKSKSKIMPFKVGDSIEGLAEVIQISRRRLVFINSSNRNKEFIEIPLNLKLNIGFKASAKKEVNNSGRMQYSMSRSDVKKYTSNLTDVLKQARMQPNMAPGGRIEGFRFDWIQPGSIFEKLGFKVGDVIKGVDGEPINDPRKAMEAYRSFKNADRLRLDVIRNGQPDTVEYSITE